MDLQQMNNTLEHITQLTMAVLLERAKQSRRPLVAPRVRALIEQCLAIRQCVPSVDECAGYIFVSTGTLRRRLVSEGTSYQVISDESRIRLAKHLLANHLTVDEVACQLGFSAPSGLSRAFKDWVGVSPREYREKWSQSISPSGPHTPTRTATSRSRQPIGPTRGRK